MVFPARVINLLRLDARKHGLRPDSADEAIAYGHTLSDEELLSIPGFGPQALAWLRARPRTGLTGPTDPDRTGKRGEGVDEEVAAIAVAADPIGWGHENRAEAGDRDDPTIEHAGPSSSMSASVDLPHAQDAGGTPSA